MNDQEERKTKDQQWEENETPSKLAKSERTYSQRDQKMDGNQQILHIAQRIDKLQFKVSSQKGDQLKYMLLTFLFLLIVGYFFMTYQKLEEINSFGRQIQQLQLKQLEWKKQAAHLEKIITSMREELDTMRRYTEKLTNQIIDIHMVQLSKPEKSFITLLKYSTPLQLSFGDSTRQKSPKSFNQHYKYSKSQKRIRKTTHQEVFAYDEKAIDEKQISYFQVKIQETQLSMISIGVFTQGKDTDCGYCQGDKMYYIYSNNANIYHGQTLQVYKKSIESKFQQIKQGDIVTVFINSGQQIIWYINSKYAGSIYLEQSEKDQKLHPFVLMTKRGDQIEILT